MSAGMNLFGLALCLLIAVPSGWAGQYVYEFGQRDGGIVIFNKKGDIPIFSYKNEFTVVVPKDMRTSYVRVTVKALSPPKVDYEAETNTVSINFAWSQVTLSSYEIYAKAVETF